MLSLHVLRPFSSCTSTDRPSSFTRTRVPCRRHASKARATTGTKQVHVTVTNPDNGAELTASLTCADGAELVKVSLRKPLGMVLEEKEGRIIVADVTAGGNADKAGIRPGDVVKATTARSQGSMGGSNSIMGELVLVAADQESLATVAAAIRSNKCSQCSITMVLERGAGA